MITLLCLCHECKRIQILIFRYCSNCFRCYFYQKFQNRQNISFQDYAWNYFFDSQYLYHHIFEEYFQRQGIYYYHYNYCFFLFDSDHCKFLVLERLVQLLSLFRFFHLSMHYVYLKFFFSNFHDH